MEIRTLKEGRPSEGGWGRRRGGRRAGLPVLRHVGARRPGERVVVPAVGHVDGGGADGDADAVGLVVGGDGAEVGVQFVSPRLLGADQLTVDGQTFNGRALASGPATRWRRTSATCSAVRHQVEDVSRAGVDVEADVHVASGQVYDEVRVVIHWRRSPTVSARG